MLMNIVSVCDIFVMPHLSICDCTSSNWYISEVVAHAMLCCLILCMPGVSMKWSCLCCRWYCLSKICSITSLTFICS